MHPYSLCVTPIQKGVKLFKIQCHQNDIEIIEIERVLYASIVESLICSSSLYFPSIAFVVNALGRYLSNLGLGHWKVVKRGVISRKCLINSYIYLYYEGIICCFVVRPLVEL
ncbi:hypothetical protein CR513_13189, partial [Mucuna pruriens]